MNTAYSVYFIGQTFLKPNIIFLSTSMYWILNSVVIFITMDKTQKLKYGLKQTREFQIKLDRLQLESKCKSFNF